MHLVFMTRGIQRQVKEFESRLNAQMWAWKRKNLKTGKEELMEVQGSLRPMQLWEYVVPEECMPDVLGALKIAGPIVRPEIKTASWFLRKMLKLDPIPANPEVIMTGYRPQGTLNGEPMPAIPVHNFFVEGVALYPVGIKKDPRQDYNWTDGTSYHQEGL